MSVYIWSSGAVFVKWKDDISTHSTARPMRLQLQTTVPERGLDLPLDNDSEDYRLFHENFRLLQKLTSRDITSKYFIPDNMRL